MKSQGRQIRFRFFCSQDKKYEKPARKVQKPNAKPRDTLKMDRFTCSSKLSITANIYDGTASVNLEHHYHLPYTDVTTQENVKLYIQSHLDDNPQKVYLDLCKLGVNSNLVQSQVSCTLRHLHLTLNSPDDADSVDEGGSCQENLSDDEDDRFSECMSQTEFDDDEVGEFEGEDLSWSAERDKAKEILQQALAMIDDQDSKGGDARWMRALNGELGGLERMQSTIRQYKGRRTMPRTWKDTNKFTMFYKF